MPPRKFSAEEIATLTASVREGLDGDRDLEKLDQRLDDLKDTIGSLNRRLSDQAAGYSQSSSAFMTTVTDLVADVKALHTDTVNARTEAHNRDQAFEKRLEDIERILSDYSDRGDDIAANAEAVKDLSDSVAKLKQPFFKRLSFWGISTTGLMVAAAFFFGDNFFRGDPMLPYYLHQFLRTDSGLGESLKYSDESKLRARIDEAAIKNLEEGKDFRTKLIRAAHERPVYTFHGGEWFQTKSGRALHPACAIKQHPGGDLLMEHSLNLASTVFEDDTERAKFIADYKAFKCPVEIPVQIVASTSLEVPFYAKPGRDKIELEVRLDHSVWDKANQKWTNKSIEIESFSVSINGRLEIEHSAFSRQQPVFGLYSADISEKMAGDGNSKDIDYHVLSVELDEPTLLIGETDAEKEPIVRVHAVIYLNRPD